MFICDECSIGKVDSFVRIISQTSLGRCEIYGKQKVCLDIHHSKLNQGITSASKEVKNESKAND